MKSALSSRSIDRRRDGVVSVVVLVVLMLVAGLIAVYAKRAVSERRQMQLELRQQQAIQLAEAGVLRFQQRLKQSTESTSDAESDVWEIPAGVIHETNSGSVQVTVENNTATIVARYPTNSPYPARVTRRIPIDDAEAND